MDSISNREEVPPVVYCISGRPTLPHHIKTLLNAEKELEQPVTLAIVVNVLKKNQMFSVEESVVLAKQLAEYMNVSPIRIIGLETQEKVAMCFQEAQIIVRRKEPELDSDSEYIKRAAAVHDAPDLPQKIRWIDSKTSPFETAGRLRALIANSEASEDSSTSEQLLNIAREFSPEFLISAIQQKIRENPGVPYFLSRTPEIEEILE